ncbi:MAG: helix-turn-helix domain-containing protein [Planctomycetes bacterium]|nr:helix-turn-helix domain-containing protein [Planctomycetota bacterium]
MARRRPINQAEIVRSFAERLRQVRLAHGMTQAALATAATVPASYVSDLEQGKVAPGIDLVARLAVALGATVADLLVTGPSEAGADVRVQLRQAFDALVRDADPDVLAALASVLPLLRELTTRRR